MRPRIAVYLRVSSDQQNHDSQRTELEEYCAHRNWTNVRWFSDVGSGIKQNREALNQLMDQVRRGRIDVIVAFKIDRLARSLNHLAQIIAELQAHNVALVCPSQGIDTTNVNPCAQFQLNILAAVAQFERELITERVNAGLIAAKQRGVRLGRPVIKRRFQIAEVERLLFAGKNGAEISRQLRIPYSTTGEMIREIKKGGMSERERKLFAVTVMA
jgi:DNA invertase Pin-like site-specific DNA recombinase